MNVAGLVLAFLGAVLVALAQLTPIEMPQSANFAQPKGYEDIIDRRIRFAKIRGRIGWGLIVFGFLLQLLAAIFAEAPEVLVVPMFM